MLLTNNIWTEITAAARNAKKPSQVAVAYFGSKGPILLPLSKGSVLVADVSIPTVAQGATSPAALEQMQKADVEIYSVQYLHAKAFAFDAVAFVGSTNASENSATRLVEASSKTMIKKEIKEVAHFVQSLCVTRLNAADLKELSKYYKPPTTSRPLLTQQQKFSSLLMELTFEQGSGRVSQVQPPKSVWSTFFGLAFPATNLHAITLTNEKTMMPEVRPVVKHHHTYTIEISDAGMPRPAILQVRRISANHYSYFVHRTADPRFSEIDHILKTLYNPFWNSGRKWVLI